MFTPPLPAEGAVVRVRQRTWLVNRVLPASFEGESSVVRLSCLDDDAAGEPLDVLWNMEADCDVIPEEAAFLDGSVELDEPRMFGAYLHALRWNTVTHQWKEELEQRFGLPFEVYDRDFVAARRRERGWGVNPWTTHSRFIVSYALLRGQRSMKKGPRTQHIELLISALGKRRDRSLLILDECHQVAPSTNTSYAIDTRTTSAIGRVARRFEHRLFLSATPHNGHSNSFSALLELLDPQRFTRGVRVKGAKELAPVMDISEEEMDAREDEWVEAASFCPGEDARKLLAEMRTLARDNRERPDARVRELDAMDRAVLAAYGWSDLEPDNRDEILRRLRKLNAKLAAAENSSAEKTSAKKGSRQ